MKRKKGPNTTRGKLPPRKDKEDKKNQKRKENGQESEKRQRRRISQRYS